VFSCEQGIYEENDKSAQKGAFWEFSRIPRFLEVNRDFQSLNDTGHYFSEVDFKTVRRFWKPFRIPAILPANHHIQGRNHHTQ
jgi:hypothetical protein